MLEFIHPLLDAYPKELLRQMHDYQSLMGEVQDAEIFIQTLNDFCENASNADLVSVRQYYERRHRDAITAFMTDKGQVLLFWRSATDEPFPWEKNIVNRS